MRKIPALTALTGVSLLLAACGSYDDASTEANADTVEMPADEALSEAQQTPQPMSLPKPPLRPKRLTRLANKAGHGAPDLRHRPRARPCRLWRRAGERTRRG